ncbi:MAG: hypothetical protein ACYCPT_12250 [Acidimicrobiales bacterium]
MDDAYNKLLREIKIPVEPSIEGIRNEINRLYDVIVEQRRQIYALKAEIDHLRAEKRKQKK